MPIVLIHNPERAVELPGRLEDFDSITPSWCVQQLGALSAQTEILLPGFRRYIAPTCFSPIMPPTHFSIKVGKSGNEAIISANSETGLVGILDKNVLSYASKEIRLTEGIGIPLVSGNTNPLTGLSHHELGGYVISAPSTEEAAGLVAFVESLYPTQGHEQ